MHQSRFVFMAMPVPVPGSTRTEGVAWALVSPNNRPLGRGRTLHETYAACRDAVLQLRREHDRIRALAFTAETTGQWSWRLDLDGETVAESSRSYLRVRECNYNLERFLLAVPEAEIVSGTRLVRRGTRRGAEDADEPAAARKRSAGLWPQRPQSSLPCAHPAQAVERDLRKRIG